MTTYVNENLMLQQFEAMASSWENEAKELDAHPKGHEDYRYGQIIKLEDCATKLREMCKKIRSA